MPSVQRWLAEVSTAPAKPPVAHRAVARRIVRDIASVAVAGQRSPAGSILREYARTNAGPGSAPVWGTDLVVDCTSAAMANAAAAQALDYDDWAPGCASHLGGVMVPAIAAPASASDPERQLDGLVVGLQVVEALAGPSFQGLYDRGLQPTHLLGTLGAVAGLAYALRLETDVAERAFGLVATQLVGLRNHTGTSYKGAQGGIAAAAAVRSVLLARAGLGAGSGAVDTVLALAGIAAADLTTIAGKTLGGLVTIAPKGYPTCGAAHSAIEATIVLRARAAAAAADAEITVVSPPAVHGALAFPDPRNPDQARFSLPYTVAVAWRNGAVTVRDFDKELLDAPETRAVMARVRPVADPSLAPAPGWSGYPAIVRVRVGGRTEESRIEEPRGYPRRPLTDEQMRAKFLECTADLLGRDPALSAYERLDSDDVFEAASRLLRSRRSFAPIP